MPKDESVSERLQRESQQLRDAAIDLMEHAALLITKSVEIDKQIVKLPSPRRNGYKVGEREARAR